MIWPTEKIEPNDHYSLTELHTLLDIPRDTVMKWRYESEPPVPLIRGRNGQTFVRGAEVIKYVTRVNAVEIAEGKSSTLWCPCCGELVYL